MNPKITVITATARYGGIDIWKESLQRQSFTNFDAILIDELWSHRFKEVLKFKEGDERLRYLPTPKKEEGKFWNLSKSLNSALSWSKGELVVFLQDYIWLPDDGLAKFWEKYKQEGKCLISGVGNKSAEPSEAAEPKGLVSIFNGPVPKPTGVWFTDPRIKGRGFHICNPIEWEGNWACAPMSIIEEIGGFDEDFDAGWGYDNVNFAERAQLAGYHCWLDEDNQCLGYSHELLFKEHEYKEQAPNNEALWAKKFDELYNEHLPFKVPYLERLKVAQCA